MYRNRCIACIVLLSMLIACAIPVGHAAAPDTILTPQQAVAEIKVGTNLASVYDGIDWSYRRGYDVLYTGKAKVDYWTTPDTPASANATDNAYVYADAFFDAGYDAIRLTVSWTPHMDDQTFHIDEEWLDEIEKAVTYITDKGMYCILDAHYDYLGRSWVGSRWAYDWMMEEHKPYVDARFAAMWGQIAERFKNHGQKVIFEAFNEPGMDGTVEQDYGDFGAYVDFCMQRVNELNALFVKTVRDVGEKNDHRLLLIGGYFANGPKRISIDRLALPDDPYLIVGFHMYPFREQEGLIWDYQDFFPEKERRRADALAKEAIKKAGDAEFALFQTEVINEMFNRIDEFVAQTGAAVIVGEWGNTEAFTMEDRMNQAVYFIRRAKRSGIPCFWWESYNESFLTKDIEFSLFDRVKAKDWKHRELLEAMMAAVHSTSIGMVTVTGNGVNLRAGVGTDFDVVASAKKGETFACTAIMDNGWYEVVLDTGEMAYVSNKLATLDANGQ